MVVRAVLCGAAVASLGLLPATGANAQSSLSRASRACTAHAPEAAQRSGLAIDTVVRVMRVESANDPRAVSRAGAMGCMQIMPGTWTYLTRRHRLGGDPFDPRMNMIGGALYLAELAARYGFPGAYSAYNAGPGRYERHVANGVRLPAETVAYTARLSGVRPAFAPRTAESRWQEASLFVARARVVTDVAADSSPPSGARGTNPLFPLAAGGTAAAAPTDER